MLLPWSRVMSYKATKVRARDETGQRGLVRQPLTSELHGFMVLEEQGADMEWLYSRMSIACLRSAAENRVRFACWPNRLHIA